LQHAYLAEKLAFLAAFDLAFLTAFDLAFLAAFELAFLAPFELAFLAPFELAFFKSCLDSSVLVKFPFQPCIVVTALVRCS
jgi:hypothetical protein